MTGFSQLQIFHFYKLRPEMKNLCDLQIMHQKNL
jgi:hypothetical protein